MREDEVGKKQKSNTGFTLVELVIVVAVMAILVGILAPQYIKYVDRSRRAADVRNLDAMVDAFKVQVIDATTTKANGEGKLVFTPGYTYAFVIWSDNANATKFMKAKQPGDKEYDGTTGDNGNWGEVPYGDETTPINEVFGKNWKQTKLKTKKWVKESQGFGDRRYIWASCYIDMNESIKVTYCEPVQEYLDKQTED